MISDLNSKHQQDEGQISEEQLEEQRRMMKERYEQKLEEWRTWNLDRHADLDSRLDSLNASFQDLMVEIKYDSGKLERSWKGPEVSQTRILYPQVVACYNSYAIHISAWYNAWYIQFGGQSFCIDARANLVTCFKEHNSGIACEEFVDALERCVSTAIVAKNVQNSWHYYENTRLRR